MAKIEHSKIIIFFLQGDSKIEIIKKTGFSKTSVYRVLANNGFGEKQFPQISTDIEKKIIHLYVLGLGAKLICDRLKIKRTRSNCVYKILAKYNIPIRKKSPGYSDLKTQIIVLYLQGFGCKTIAKILDISKSTATKYIKQNCKVRPRKRPSVRTKRERDKLFMQELDYFNRVAYVTWKSNQHIHLDDFKQSAYLSALRAAEVWVEKATYRTYAVKCINFGFISLFKQNPKHFAAPTYQEEII